jgi:hypothetical protein
MKKLTQQNKLYLVLASIIILLGIGNISFGIDDITSPLSLLQFGLLIIGTLYALWYIYHILKNNGFIKE